MEEKEYEIEEDCMWDRERMEYVTTMYQCGCCHAKVEKNDTICWHCRSKLSRRKTVPVYENTINKCECGATVNRYWHPKFCGFCGRELLWY